MTPADLTLCAVTVGTAAPWIMSALLAGRAQHRHEQAVTNASRVRVRLGPARATTRRG